MKRIITITAITLFAAANVQAQPYSKEREEDIQTSVMHNSRSKLGAMFIDFNINWVGNISVFLQENGYRPVDIRNKNLNVFEHKLVNPSPYSSDNNFVKITGYYDKNMRTTSVVIDGTPDELVYLFVNYWEDTHVSINNLKKGGYVYQDFGSDRIIFEWKGTNPRIRIIHNPEGSRILWGSK
ncbi:MAG: hypothetical protein ACK4EY_14595 [Flavipsychrobacter sp.]